MAITALRKSVVCQIKCSRSRGIDQDVRAILRHVAAGDLLRAGPRRPGRPQRRHSRGHQAPLLAFTETTSPLIAYYQDRGILMSVDAGQAPESVTAAIEARPAGLPVLHSTAHQPT